MVRFIVVAAALLIGSGAISAQTKEQDHQAHHPDGAASAALAKPSAKASALAPAKSADRATRMKAMQEMHQKMMDAKTPEERQALMGEHMKAMQAGMGMMKQMSGPETGGDAGMKGMPADPNARMQAMEQRMNLMQTMMEMMMDRMAVTPMPGNK